MGCSVHDVVRVTEEARLRRGPSRFGAACRSICLVLRALRVAETETGRPGLLAPPALPLAHEPVANAILYLYLYLYLIRAVANAIRSLGPVLLSVSVSS